jgi:hypothetical protein
MTQTEPAAKDDGPSGEFPRRFGAYVLRREVGRGGMGVVYEAVHDQRRRPEALKVVRASLAEEPEALQRFLREVSALAQVSHDHVVPLFDSGTVAGEAYFTMPLLPGPGLDDLLEDVRATGESPPGAEALVVLDRHGIPPLAGPPAPPGVAYARRLAAALAGVADALQALHAAGIVHRDVKPSNLLLDERRRVRLADFGLVRTGDPRLTDPGRLMGTPSYMSPEQVVLDQGKDLDGRADVYSLGAVLFELLTLRLPHQGATLAETMGSSLRRRAPSARSLNPALPDDADVLLGRCLERRSEDRPDARALADDLRRLAEGDRVRIRPVSLFRRASRYVRQHAVPIGVAVLVLIGAVTWWLRLPARLTVDSLPVASVVWDGGVLGPTPLRDVEVAPGRHHLRVEREGFVPYVPPGFEGVGRGEHVRLHVVLQAVDPFSPESGSVLANGLGLRRTEVEVTRSAGAAPLLAPVWPRGAVRAAPEAIDLVAADPTAGRLRIRDAKGAGIHEAEVPDSYGPVRVALPPAVRAALVPGAAYEVVVTAGDRGRETVATFRVLSPAEVAAVDAWLERALEGFRPGDPSAELLAAEWLLKHDLYREAVDRLEVLESRAGPRKEIARRALGILQRAGLEDVGPWESWYEGYVAWPE